MKADNYFLLKNNEAKKILLMKDYQQNKNDYEYRNVYDKFKYKFLNNSSKRKVYCEEFFVLLNSKVVK